MNFIDKVRTGRLFAGWKKTIEKEETTILKTFPVAPEGESLPVENKQIGPDLIIRFVFMEKTYIVEDLNLNFRQDMDKKKNRPDSFTYGGQIQLTISEAPDYSINEWMAQSYMTRSGEIRFFPNTPKIIDSALLTIYFSDAYCVAYNKKVNPATYGILTTLTISPRTIKIGNEEFENKWKNKETHSHTIKSV
ncbi:MAG: hypothetical protein LBT25_10355 [Candidatus Symbiothrix sp.]|jgi:hypothetical protein|nr:hypothetical protein [Candidatus Symbiothrix sp.]